MWYLSLSDRSSPGPSATEGKLLDIRIHAFSPYRDEALYM